MSYFDIDDYEFLSIQAQDFIEEPKVLPRDRAPITFLSIQAQDFIEDIKIWFRLCKGSDS